ncbi:MAG TPA: hypothetical protein VKY74_14270 [Chloroflexia bacterium]|nr:hypothetical protein [Chloroflexia bacterium]
MRTGLLVGAAFGVVAAGLFFPFTERWIPLLVEALLAIVAGAVAAYLAGRVPVPLAPARPGAPAVTWRSIVVRAGTAAGAVVGVLGGLAFTVVTYQLLGDATGRAQLAESLRQAGLSTSADALISMLTLCVGCIFVILIPTLTGGLGALGGWLYSLTRPASAPPPLPLGGPGIPL